LAVSLVDLREHWSALVLWPLLQNFVPETGVAFDLFFKLAAQRDRCLGVMVRALA